MLEELLLIDGRNLLLDGRTLIERAAPILYAHARRVGAELHIETDKERTQIAINDSYALVNR